MGEREAYFPLNLPKPFKFKLELPDKMKNIVKERQYKWQFCSGIIES